VRITGDHDRQYFGVFICSAILLCTSAGAEVTDIADECDRCHGAGGVSTESDVPSIAGISPFILEEYMFEYRDGARACRESKYRTGDLEQPATDMCVVADDLSEGDVTAIAEFYSSKKFVAAPQEFDAEKALVGAKVHKKLCKKCHSDGGSYADDDASILAGQWMPYLEQALADQISGDRTMLDEKMREKTDELNGDDKESLLHFYGSQQ